MYIFIERMNDVNIWSSSSAGRAFAASAAAVDGGVWWCRGELAGVINKLLPAQRTEYTQLQ